MLSFAELCRVMLAYVGNNHKRSKSTIIVEMWNKNALNSFLTFFTLHNTTNHTKQQHTFFFQIL